MYAAFSMTESASPILSFILLSSFSACLRFLSADVCACVLLSQVLSRIIELFIDADSGLPVASLSAAPITVERPMSCIVRDVPAPTLLLSDSSFENDLHSGPDSSSFSAATKPQFLQNISPVASSVCIVFFAHDGHLGCDDVICV